LGKIALPDFKLAYYEMNDLANIIILVDFRKLILMSIERDVDERNHPTY
jgi:hypothetical protein